MRKKKRNRGGKWKMCWAKRMFLERSKWCNRHHDIAKSQGGTFAPANIYLLDERRHAALHLLFGNRSFYQIAELLIRAHNMKKGTSFYVGERPTAVC